MTHVWSFHDQHGEGNPDCTCSAHWRHYQCDGKRETPNGLRIASVTQALSVIDKSGPLVNWATKIDVDAALDLATARWRRCTRKSCENKYVPIKDEAEACATCNGLLRSYRLPDAGWKLQQDMKRAGIDHNSVVGEAQIRGTDIHKLHEDYVEYGKIPNPMEHREEWRGWVMAMARYIMDCEQRGEVSESSEVIVGSATHGFAGTCDTVAVTTGHDGKRTRRDFKTSKDAFARSHFRQLAAYELAAVEMGQVPTDDQAVVVLCPDGTYRTAHVSEVEWTVPPAQAFLNVLQVWRDDQPLKAHEDATYKARVAREKAERERAKESV